MKRRRNRRYKRRVKEKGIENEGRGEWRRKKKEDKIRDDKKEGR